MSHFIQWVICPRVFPYPADFGLLWKLVSRTQRPACTWCTLSALVLYTHDAQHKKYLKGIHEGWFYCRYSLFFNKDALEADNLELESADFSLSRGMTTETLLPWADLLIANENCQSKMNVSFCLPFSFKMLFLQGHLGRNGMYDSGVVKKRHF